MRTIVVWGLAAAHVRGRRAGEDDGVVVAGGPGEPRLFLRPPRRLRARRRRRTRGAVRARRDVSVGGRGRLASRRPPVVDGRPGRARFDVWALDFAGYGRSGRFTRRCRAGGRARAARPHAGRGAPDRARWWRRSARRGRFSIVVGTPGESLPAALFAQEHADARGPARPLRPDRAGRDRPPASAPSPAGTTSRSPTSGTDSDTACRTACPRPLARADFDVWGAA
jgi:hypothetical protein